MAETAFDQCGAVLIEPKDSITITEETRTETNHVHPQQSNDECTANEEFTCQDMISGTDTLDKGYMEHGYD